MPVEIIAEIAQGYEGDPTLAWLLARGAVRAGADAVKLQLVYADEISTPDYQYYELFRSLEMSPEAWRRVAKEIKAGGARLYLDVFGEKSLSEAVALGVEGVKIHTTDFYNTKLVRMALDMCPRVFVSLGGISVEELEKLLADQRILPSARACLMYGFQAEPTPIEFNNLRRLGALRARFPGYGLGFMDHSKGSGDEAMTLALMSLSFGVDCIEKHLTLDPTLELEDCVSALPPERFRLFVERIRNLEKALGTDDLKLTAKELEYRKKAMKVVVSNKNLKKGEAVSATNLSLKRTSSSGSSGSIYRIEDVVGRRLKVDIGANQQLTEEMLS